jgi:hypothetical protein
MNMMITHMCEQEDNEYGGRAEFKKSTQGRLVKKSMKFRETYNSRFSCQWELELYQELSNMQYP